MRLGVFGDSYAEGDIFSTVSWPRKLADKLNCKYDTFALGGSSLFYSYKNFIRTYEKYTHVVFVYTSHLRSNIMPDHLERFSNLLEYNIDNLRLWAGVDPVFEEELEVIVKARKYTDNHFFSEFVYQAIFDKVNSVCQGNGIRLVNLHPFEKPNDVSIDISSRAGNCLFNLLEISSRELGNSDNIWFNQHLMADPSFLSLVESDIRPNHLNNHNNKELADVIYLAFDEKNEPFDLVTHPGFCYDKNLVVDMIEAASRGH